MAERSDRVDSEEERRSSLSSDVLLQEFLLRRQHFIRIVVDVRDVQSDSMLFVLSIVAAISNNRWNVWITYGVLICHPHSCPTAQYVGFGTLHFPFKCPSINEPDTPLPKTHLVSAAFNDTLNLDALSRANLLQEPSEWQLHPKKI